MRWSETADDLQLIVGCEGGRHRLGWHRGTVEPLDHPELEAELAMVALGGPEPSCLSLLHLWNDAVRDGGFLAEWVDETRLTPALFSWLAMALERMRSEGFHEFLRDLPPARAQRMGWFLHSFPPPWIDRAAATVSQAVAEGDGVDCLRASPLLAQAVANRLRRAFVDSVGGRQLSVGAAALVPLRVSTTGGGERAEPSVRGDLAGAGRGVALTVDPSWLHRVWAAGAAVIDGGLVLALEPSSRSADDRARVAMVRWEPDSDHRLQPRVEWRAVRFAGDGWQSA